MKSITHTTQKRIWEEEHLNPFSLLQMDSNEPSSGVIKFYDWLKQQSFPSDSTGIELGCGKGRNVVWLAKLGIEMTGIDFAQSAITEAIRRAKEEHVEKSAHFKCLDATKPWDIKTNVFDFGIDCFATTDIESKKGRSFAAFELRRVVKPGGYILAYLLSPQDEYHAEVIKKSPSKEKNAFIHPKTGKFEKTFNLEEIEQLYRGCKLVFHERIPKVAEFFGKKYNCLHHFCIFQNIAQDF